MCKKVDRHDREVASLSSHKGKAKASIVKLDEDVNGKFNQYTKTCDIGLASQIAYLTKKLQRQVDNNALLMDHLDIEFIDLKEERIIHKKDS